MKIQGTTVATPIARRAVPDDKSVSKAPWSSKHTVDTLCPAFEESGSVVACEPVEGYPLEVESKIVPKQSGSGDPSPENVRPISAWTGAKLWQGGKNLLPTEEMKVAQNWFNNTISNSGYRNYPIKVKPNTTYTLSMSENGVVGSTGTELYVSLRNTIGTYWENGGICHGNGDKGYCKSVVSVVSNDEGYLYLSFYNVSQGQLDLFFSLCKDLMLEEGSVATEYEPYRGEEITVDFGQNVYGGSYNWKTGLLTDSMVHSVLTGTENWNALGSSWQGAGKFGCYASILEQSTKSFDYKPSYSELPCSHCIPGNWGWGSATETGLLLLKGKVVYMSFSKTALGITDADSDAEMVEKFKAYLVGQYANGTPVEFCYVPTAEPTTAQLTPQEILALSGVNTLYTDTGDTTVSGRADTTAVIEKLTSAIIALGGNV